ncbi:hypothetical protein Gpo141_00004016 [Globisporangium polare]
MHVDDRLLLEPLLLRERNLQAAGDVVDHLLFDDEYTESNAELLDVSADCEPQWNFAAAAMALCNAQDGGYEGEYGGEWGDSESPLGSPHGSEKSAVSKKRGSTASRLVVTTSGGNRKKRRAPRQNKKATYLVQKEEKQRLLQEMEVLQMRLKDLEDQRSSPTGSLAVTKRKNTMLRECVRSHQLSLATSQCVISRLLSSENANPVSINHICLGSDWEDRRKTLLAMKERTIRHASEYIDARSRFLDPLKRHVSEERFETLGGDFCCAQFDVQHFTNVNSVRQVYDVLVSYMYNIEISVSERLGDITTRDDFDMVENSIAHFRFFTTEFGVPVEKHGVLFMEYFDSHELFDGEPCGVVVIDRVEEDELFPYTPQERMRRDISAAVVLRPHWRPKPVDQGGTELVVSMSMGKFEKLHHSECPLATSEVEEKMRENVMGWGGVMTTTMREILDQQPQ